MSCVQNKSIFSSFKILQNCVIKKNVKAQNHKNQGIKEMIFWIALWYTYISPFLPNPGPLKTLHFQQSSPLSLVYETETEQLELPIDVEQIQLPQFNGIEEDSPGKI